MIAMVLGFRALRVGVRGRCDDAVHKPEVLVPLESDLTNYVGPNDKARSVLDVDAMEWPVCKHLAEIGDLMANGVSGMTEDAP